jgi:hypothetical protein
MLEYRIEKARPQAFRVTRGNVEKGAKRWKSSPGDSRGKREKKPAELKL